MTAPLDIAALRAATPACAKLVHFNQAGAGLPPASVLEAMARQMEREAAEGPMEAAAEGAAARERARSLAAGLLGCSAAEIAIAPGGGAAWGMAVASLPPFAAGDRILVSRQEWGGNLATLQLLAARCGAQIAQIPAGEDGRADLEALAAQIDGRVRLICLTWLPCNGGLIDDAAGIGRIARAAGVPFLVDAAQALGQLPVDVGEIGCDMLAGTARKHLRGPRGTALLYLRQGFAAGLVPPWADTGSAPIAGGVAVPREDARRFEGAEVSAVLMAGLAAALELATELGTARIRARVAGMAGLLRARLGALPGIALLDRGGPELSGLVAFRAGALPPAALRDRLAARGIAIGANGPAYTPLDMAARGLDGVARATVSYLTTEAEIDALCAALAEILGGRNG
ncbi:aminotransferase class V-fold PLP-dependent enzyme [Poseidonocella sp. HB161398]|uniref:aminotransferase class V-fold PLP-dependent enzyme n=1 Tax=Poseidonocella sp. HB161398 TaxID=2320855 RepID=UPI001108006C|nr:aminotransferase class V-fold PLP-dependent enzyme [Poseidonocella sp. HB161398]